MLCRVFLCFRQIQYTVYTLYDQKYVGTPMRGSSLNCYYDLKVLKCLRRIGVFSPLELRVLNQTCWFLKTWHANVGVEELEWLHWALTSTPGFNIFGVSSFLLYNLLDIWTLSASRWSCWSKCILENISINQRKANSLSSACKSAWSVCVCCFGWEAHAGERPVNTLFTNFIYIYIY